MNTQRLFWLIALILIGALAVAACSSSPPPASEVEAGHDDDQAAEADPHEDEHEDEADHHDDDADAHSPDDHMAGQHNVPEEAAAVPNPIEANDESIAAGGALYATNCAICHGESGEGDGPGAAGLEKKPADLHEAHVQELSDGALFYIISHGKSETPMPAWENVLNEEQRWQVVNSLRTFRDE